MKILTECDICRDPLWIKYDEKTNSAICDDCEKEYITEQLSPFVPWWVDKGNERELTVFSGRSKSQH